MNLKYCAAVAAMLVAGSASANLILNGDFQTGAASSWSTPAAGASVIADAGPAGAGDYAFRVTTGDWSGVIAANNGASMGVGDETYTVSFDVKANDITYGGQTQVYVQKAWGGNYPGVTIVANQAPYNTGEWQHVSWNVTVNDGPFMVGIYAAGGGNRDLTFDNFSVAVPEPLSLGLVGLAIPLMMRRRRA